MRKPSLLIIFLTVFVDLIGFGIVLPLLPIYSRDFGASGLVIGLIMASFSLMQFLFAPVWGRLSDRIGRRPVLLISIGGSVVSYAIFAIGSGLQNPTAALVVLVISRVFAGVCGANITVAQAYIADITPPEQRSKRMGLIGMAFGLGFVFGPVVSWAGIKLFGITGPGWLAVVLTGLNFLVAFARLPESWKPDTVPAQERPRLQQWRGTLRHPGVGLLIALFFFATFAFTCFEMTLGLLVGQRFGLKIGADHDLFSYDTRIILLYAYCGVIGAVVQGGLIGRAVKILGEPNLIAVSLVLTAVAMFFLPFVQGWGPLLVVLALLSVGSSLTRPPVFGLISNLTPANEQGVTLGVAQSAGSLARIAGPIFAGTLFDVRPSLPYEICGIILVLAAILGWTRLKPSVRSSAKADPIAASPGY